MVYPQKLVAMLKLIPRTLSPVYVLLALSVLSGCSKRASSMNPYKEGVVQPLGIYQSHPKFLQPCFARYHPCSLEGRDVPA